MSQDVCCQSCEADMAQCPLEEKSMTQPGKHLEMGSSISWHKQKGP